MDTRRKPSSMAVECLEIFHGVDQTAFRMLRQVLNREVTQSLMVIAFLLSMETMGLSGILQTAIKKDGRFMNSLAEDCVICLQCLLSPEFSGVLDKSRKLETLRHALKTELTLYQVHRIRSILLTIIPDTLSNICSRILGDVTMDAVWLEYQRNLARLLGFNTHDDGISVAPEELSRHNNGRRMHMQQGGRQTEQEKGNQKYICKELDDAEHPKTLTVCFGRESMPTADGIAEFFCNLFGHVVQKVTVMPRREKDSGDFAFVLFNDASIPGIIMETKMLFIIPYKA
ncbi:hypothetical protein HN51_041003 [Arachis hypogaea]|uniref:Uncharacterized protein n=1 Tax=Arachis hypogaea TaxID=3818 RepID=A0A444YQS1_ARAHY|nr:uncharacterized protein LOC107647173 [Arachis ipaensis]XP_025661785.1 uncharacterized protein LOC112757411 [Arachis hypogaea]RYR04257.1 hypothetical protein Ahy_B06g083895 [Arachis hypogaea]